LHRYAEARQIAEGMAGQATKLVAAALAGDRPVAVNSLARRRGGLVELSLPGHEPRPHEQLLHAIPPYCVLPELAAADAPIRLAAELGVRPNVHGVEFLDAPDDVLRVRLVIDPTKGGRFPAQNSVQEMLKLAEADPARRVVMELADIAQRRVLVHVAD